MAQRRHSARPQVPALGSFAADAAALVIGASGGIGAALVAALQRCPQFTRTVGLGRTGTPALEIESEQSIAAAARALAQPGVEVRLVVAATGFLHGGGYAPEKSLRELDPVHLGKAFLVNAIGPALLMKHFLPLLPRTGKSVFAALSARVGSIGDNRLGGWYGYRASKAALNQLVRTASIELRRRRPDAICVALHPGTVDTPLSAPFARAGLQVQSPAEAAARLLRVIDALTAADSGGFFDQHGQPVPW